MGSEFSNNATSFACKVQRLISTPFMIRSFSEDFESKWISIKDIRRFEIFV